MAHEFTTSYIQDATSLFLYYKKLGEGAMAQLSDEQLFFALDAEMNSIAIIVKHMSGNMRSRWTDFLTSDGEKADRNRDGEFEDAPQSREEMIKLWNDGWQIVLGTLQTLSDADVTRTVMIRSEPHSVTQAINRQIAHYAYHIGQIVFLAKHLREKNWKSLSVPRGQSQQFNRKVVAGEASQR